MKFKGPGKKNKKGFTVIEVLFVVVLIAVLLAVTYPYLRAFHNGWQSADRRSEIMQNARVGLDKMARELRKASSFTSIQSSLVGFADVDGSSITYRLNSGNLERNNAVLAGPLDSLSFTYYDSSGVVTADAGDVKSVKIAMTVSESESAVSPLSFTSTVFIRSTASGVTGEGYQFSKNSDFSTEDTVFNTTDTFYIRAWSDQVDYNNLDSARCELKRLAVTVTFNLTNNLDGTYTGSRSLSGFTPGTWTVTIDIKDNNIPSVRYRPLPLPTITVQ